MTRRVTITDPSIRNRKSELLYLYVMEINQIISESSVPTLNFPLAVWMQAFCIAKQRL